MGIIVILFIVLLLYLNWRDNWHLTYAKIFLALLMSFHLLPLIWLYFDDYINSSNEWRNQILLALSRVLLCCLFMVVGVLLSRFVFKRHVDQNLGRTITVNLNVWRTINIVTGIIIIINNAAVARYALEQGYLDIYVSTPTFFPIKTITVLPIYVFTLFLFFFDWIQVKQMNIRKLKRSVLIVFVLVGISFLLTGSRSTMIYLVIALFVTFSSRVDIKAGRYLPVAIGVVVLSVIIGLLRDGSFSQLDLSTVALRPLYELANTSFVFLRCDSISDQFSIGSRYISGLLHIFPVTMLNVIGITPPPMLSQQYVNIIDPGWAAAGGGFGFSILAEFYLIGGPLGALFFALVTGIFTGWIDLKLKSENCLKSALVGSIGFILLFSVRGEIIELYRNLSVFLLLYFVGSWHSGRKSVSSLRLGISTTC